MFLSFVPTNVIRPLLFLTVIAVLGLTGNAVTAASAMMYQWVAIIVVAAATTVASRRLTQHMTGDVTPQYDTRQWVRIALPLMAVTLFTAYFPEFLVILTGAWLASDDLAVFHISYRIALLIAFGIFAVDAFTAPEAARLHAAGDWQTLQRVTNHATRLRFWGSVAAVLLLSAAGKWLLSLFGADFVRGYGALMILALAQLVQAAVGPVTRLMSVSGHQDRCLVVFGCALALAVALVAVLVPRYGILGAAFAAFLDMALWSVWMRYLVVQYLGIRPSFV
jgi:O-antigen/teichoic acid export membrane protein